MAGLVGQGAKTYMRTWYCPSYSGIFYIQHQMGLDKKEWNSNNIIAAAECINDMFGLSCCPTTRTISTRTVMMNYVFGYGQHIP